MSAAAATRPATGRKRASDAVLEGAVDLARSALGDEPVGEHLGFTLEAERLGTHYFAATAPGYHGWRWYVTLSRIPRSRNATVCESGLLPGDRKSTRLNSSHVAISYAVFCLKKKNISIIFYCFSIVMFYAL